MIPTVYMASVIAVPTVDMDIDVAGVVLFVVPTVHGAGH